MSAGPQSQNASQPVLELERFPAKFLLATIIGTGLTMAWLVSGAYRSHQVLRRLQERDLRIMELRGEIVHLDEVLTMSARMAAATGDAGWEARYHDHEPRLDAAIKAAIQLAPDAFAGESASQTDTANLKLVEMEHAAFEHVRAGALAQARDVLYGTEYEAQKRVYARGMEQLAAQLKQLAVAELGVQRAKFVWDLLMVGIMLPLLAASWAMALWAMRRWRTRLLQQSQRIVKQAKALATMNALLDRRVIERTTALEQSNEQLRHEIDDRRHAEQEARAALDRLQTTQEQLVQSEKLAVVGRLASSVAHEVKNPLQIILAGVNFLEGEPQPAGPATEALQMIKAAVVRADKIVYGLLDFAKPRPPSLNDCLVETMMRRALDLVRKQYVAKDIAVREVFAMDLPMIRMDEHQITQVFVNIIMNAVQAMPGGGTLTLRAEKKILEPADPIVRDGSAPHCRPGQPVVICEVEDTGAGIDPRHLPRLFEPFFSTKGLREGAGLGLSIVRTILERHRGAVRVASIQGRGTTVTITLPAETTPASSTG
jgi:signal transduction histidine kinase